VDDQNQRREQRRQRLAGLWDRALSDPEFRAQWLDNPAAGSPESGRQAQLPPQVQQLRRQLVQQVLDRASSDQQFRQQLTQNPRRAIREGFGPQIEQLRAEQPPEVKGYWAWGGWYPEPDGWVWYPWW
jgi:hypothetical protein